jgi:hypothetical protein
MWRRRRENHLETKHQRGERLESKADQMLAYPHAKATTDDGKTTVLPAPWNNFRAAAAIAAMGTRMKEEAIEEALREAVTKGGEEECKVNWNLEDYTPEK